MRCSTLLPVFLIALAASTLSAAEPVIRTMDVRGLQIGGKTTLTFDGTDFGKAPRLLLPFAVKQTLKPKSTSTRASFEIVLDNNVPAGLYNLRLVAEGGVSAPVVVGVDRLVQQAVTAPVKTMPVALHGTLAGSNIAEVKIQGKSGQTLLIETESQRLGSKLRPVVHLYDAKKRQLAWTWGTPNLLEDARMQVTLPADGTYFITLHDAEYAAPNPSFYRLKIGQWAFVDQVFPPVIARNQSVPLELLGMGSPRIVKPAPDKNAGIKPLPWPESETWSGPRPFVKISGHPEVLQQSTKGKPQNLPGGKVGVSGKITSEYGETVFRIPVTPGQKVKLEVFAERLGSVLDTALIVRNDKGGQLARGEDSPGSLDPVLEYKVPAKVTSILVAVADVLGQGKGIYRLVVDPQSPTSTENDFSLTTTQPTITLAESSVFVVPVLVERNGYQGKIDLALKAPPGVKLSGTTIPENADGALVTLERGKSPVEALITSWHGKADDGSERVAMVKDYPLEKLQPWLATEIAVAASDAKAEVFTIDWNNFATDTRLLPGTKLKLPVKVMHTNEKTTVRLTLLTSQLPPLLNNNQPDPKKTLRQEKAVTLPAKKNEGEVVLLVPVEMSSPVYDVALKAELLTGNKVLATTFTKVQKLAVQIPVVVKLKGSNRIEAKLENKKATVLKLEGIIERDKGLKTDVVVKLTGLPAGAKTADVKVKPDAKDFTVNVTLPANIKAGDYKGLKLTANYAPNPKQANVRVNCKDVDLTLVLKAPAK